jgi:sporulation-control protein spo0M
MIRLELSQESVHNGDRVTGHAAWSSSGGKEPRNVQVICRWRIEGKPRRKEEVIDKASGGHEVPFNFQIPRDGPVSYDGKLFRIVWEIVATADIPFALDEEEVKSFLVRPRPWNADEWKEEEDEDDDDDGVTASLP